MATLQNPYNLLVAKVVTTDAMVEEIPGGDRRFALSLWQLIAIIVGKYEFLDLSTSNDLGDMPVR